MTRVTSGGSSRKNHVDRGVSVAVEATLIIPVLVLFVALVVVLARDCLAQQSIGAAASQAARAASLERSGGAARDAAESAVTAALADAGDLCSSHRISVDLAALTAPPGTPSAVSVTVTCVVSYGLTLPGFPQERTWVETRTSPVDTWRGR